MAALKIIGLGILAAVLYGVAQDQVTARVCVEYFTIGHPRILATESPTILGLAWGVIPDDRHVAFIAVGWTHGASYVAGFVGGLVLIRSVWRDRRAASTVPPNPAMR